MPLPITIGAASAKAFGFTAGGGGGLYPFTAFLFQTTNLRGYRGPTRAQCLAFYNTTTYPWLNDTSFFNVTTSGLYYVTVANLQGCEATDSVQVVVDCKGVYFPTAFTPNADGKNDAFGPVGDVGALSDYHLRIYSRWGQIVFDTQNPFEKWNGLFKSKTLATESYIWLASYRINGEYFANKKGVSQKPLFATQWRVSVNWI